MQDIVGSGRLHRGSSGAAITRLITTVNKVGGDREVAQGLWMQKHECDALPKVKGVGETGYAMEKLTPLPIDLLDVHTTLLEIFRKLETHIWSQPAQISMRMIDHAAKLESLRETTSLSERILLDKLRYVVNWSDLADCLTHGDPTVDNAMLRNGEIVLTDPIPATTAIPDLRAVDLGKMIQSYVGYEMYRYQLNGPRHGERLSEFLDIICIDSNEKVAALYFAVVHFVRAHPYMSGDTNRRLREYCLPIIEEAAVPWMR